MKIFLWGNDFRAFSKVNEGRCIVRLKMATTAAAAACAVVTFAGLVTAPAAYAESGKGGCNSFSDVDTFPNDDTVILWKSCISEKATRVGHPYAFVSMGKSHPTCNIIIRVLTVGEKIVSKKTYPCPSGKVINKQYTGNDFHGTGEFTTWVTMDKIHTEANLSPRSPWLNLK
ncbi:hypothetical protein [Streptomyces graminilatus]|uniref:hypothetical protein n=1 Tax=Streptomyces graminilatus TaxID=1464070 RepID=UPI0012FEF8B2|nr:hypothetical protein [Streptomyces graminilatus]